MAISLMILAIVMGISLSISVLTIREFKTASETANSSAAYFGADTGMERALYANFQEGVVPPVAPYQGTLPNGITYKVDLAKKEKATGSLQMDETKQLNLIGNDIQEITLTWQRSVRSGYDVPADPPPSMQYKLVSFPLGDFDESEIEVTENLCDLACAGGWKIPIDVASDRDHILRFKPLKNGADYEASVTIGGGQLEVLTITSVGEARKGLIRRALITEINDDSGVTGLWDYVLFSQQSLF